MKHMGVALLASAAVLLAIPDLQSAVQAQGRDRDRDRGRSLKADLVGFEEVPAVSSTGRGEFSARVSPDDISFEYVVSFRDLEGDVTQSHIHFGQMSVSGGISLWLCGTATNPGPAGTPACGGPRSGTASRVVFATDVIGPSGQGISAGEFAEVLRAIREGVAYANIHSTKWPAGEVRGQIRGRDRDDD